jgi:hypothetical protein
VLGDELLQPVLGFMSSAMASQVGMIVAFMVSLLENPLELVFNSNNNGYYTGLS